MAELSDSSHEEYLTRFEHALKRFCDPPQNNRLQLPPGYEVNGQEGDSLIQEIVRHSDEVQRIDNDAPRIQTDWDPSCWVFSLVPQVHTGGRSGMGGRSPGSTVDVRLHFRSLLYSVLSTRLLLLDQGGQINLQDFFDPRAIAKLKSIHSQGMRNLYKSHFAILKGNLLGVYAKFTQRDAPTAGQDDPEVRIANARDRHLLCLWVDREGKARCSCIGSTLFAARSNSGQFATHCCDHAKHMYSFFKSMLPFSSVNPSTDSRQILRNLSTTITGALEAPRSFMGFNGTAAFLAYRDVPNFGTSGEQWVPLRVHKKRKGALTCAFCDMRTENNCAHIFEWKRCKELGLNESSLNELAEGLPESEENEEISSRLDKEYIEEKPGRSYLPLGPMNCRDSVQVDSNLAAYVKANGDAGSASRVCAVRAPQKCYACDSQRDEMSRKEMDEGILSCSTGPVRMRVETYRCSNSECGSLVYEEGRSKHIVFYSFTSAATHAFMRREIQAVVLSGGTITNRFNNYLRNRLEDRSSGVLPRNAHLRSIKMLTNLFALTVKLMVLEPSPRLFTCSTCEVDKEKRFSAVCVDGIWAGYDRESAKPLVLVSEKCDPIPPGRATSHRARPNTNLFRSDVVATIIASAIKGEKKDMVSEKTVAAALSALRAMEPELIPKDWDIQPILSHITSGREMESLLSAFRETTFVLFKRDIIVYRLAKSMLPYLLKRRKRLSTEKTRSRDGRRKRNPRKQLRLSELLSNPAVIDSIISLAQRRSSGTVPVYSLAGEGKVCWSDEVLAVSRECRRNLYDLYALMLHGPLTQFVLASEIPSLKEVATLFSFSRSTTYIRRQFLTMCEQNSSSNIVKCNKFLMGSLLSVVELQETAKHRDGKIVEAVGLMLHAVCDLVSTFYEAYDEFDESEASAIMYRNRWERTSPRLFRSYITRNSDVRRQALGFNDIFKSGTFFPNHPPVRPMPFNDKTDFQGQHRDYGPCSKHYDTQRPDFTPGAITFCCTCPNPIIFGFKVLERGEGPRAILDVLISRFPDLPRYIVYDFACGLLRSAQHTLWWATKNTTFVSDRFHVDNHTCHRGFHPDSYNYLNGRNSVSHEQRNRPIAKLKESLRNCSQMLYISLLAYHTTYLNFKAKILQRKSKIRAERATSVASIACVSRRKRSRVEGDAEPSQEEVQIWYFEKFKFTAPCCQG